MCVCVCVCVCVCIFRIIANKSHCPTLPCFHSQSHQEFIFKEYLKIPAFMTNRPGIIHVQYPDLVWLFTPVVHDVARVRQQEYRTSLLLLRDTIQNHVPETSNVFWMNSPSINPQHNLKYQNVTSNEKISVFNDILFNVLESEWSEKGNILPFFNLSALSQTVMQWYKDRVHMKSVWYENIAVSIMQTFCL